jgi:hypothetical protein
MTEFDGFGQPRDELTYSEQRQIAETVGRWAQTLPPRTPLMHMLGPGRTVRAHHLARAMTDILGTRSNVVRPSLSTILARRQRELAEHVLDLFALSAREYGLAELLSRVDQRPESAGPAVAGA